MSAPILGVMAECTKRIRVLEATCAAMRAGLERVRDSIVPGLDYDSTLIVLGHVDAALAAHPEPTWTDARLASEQAKRELGEDADSLKLLDRTRELLRGQR